MNVERATEIIVGIDETIELLSGFCDDYREKGNEIGANSAIIYLDWYKKLLRSAIQNAELKICEEDT